MKLPLSLFTTLLLFPLVSWAQGNTLVNVGIDPNADFSGYLNTLYAIAIVVAALLAVIKIAIGGVKYMLSEVVTSKADAKKDIRGAVFGLIIVLGAFLILNTINSGLVGGSIGGNISQLQATGVAPATTTPPALTTCPYTANPATGYTWIPVDAPPCEQNQFRADCTAPSRITMEVAFVAQLRCNDPVAAATVSRLSSHYGSLTPTQQADFETQYQTFVAPWEITNTSTLTSIQTSLGVSDVVYAVDTLANGGITPQNRGQAISMCENQLDAANGNAGNYQIVFEDLDANGTDETIVCVQI
jgi:hypothetical protein